MNDDEHYEDGNGLRLNGLVAHWGEVANRVVAEID